MGALKQFLIDSPADESPDPDLCVLSPSFSPSLDPAYLHAYVLLMDGRPTTIYLNEADALRDKWLEEQASAHGNATPDLPPPAFSIECLPLCRSLPF